MAASASALSSSSLSSTSSPSLCPLEFIATVQGSSPLAQEAPLVLTVDFETPEQAKAYMEALYKTHMQFMRQTTSMQFERNPRDYKKTIEFLSQGAQVIRENWRKGDRTPPPIPNGIDLGTFEDNGSMTRVTRLDPKSAAKPARPFSAAAADASSDEQVDCSLNGIGSVDSDDDP